MEYTLIRSDRKTVSISITREGTVEVRAPQRLDEKKIRAFVESRQSWIEKHLARQQEIIAAHPEPDEEQRKALIQKARDVLPGKVVRYSAQMGLTPTRITITGAKTKFGSCSGKDSICFSWRLMQYPDEAVDYVVVHELAHIRHKNHGKAFYALIESVLPDYKQREKLLRQ